MTRRVRLHALIGTIGMVALAATAMIAAMRMFLGQGSVGDGSFVVAASVSIACALAVVVSGLRGQQSRPGDRTHVLTGALAVLLAASTVVADEAGGPSIATLTALAALAAWLVTWRSGRRRTSAARHQLEDAVHDRAA